MDRLIKASLFAVLLGLTTTIFAASHQCPPASAFAHKAPGEPWTVDATGWLFDQGGSQNSTLETFPASAKSYVLITPGRTGYIQCTYNEEGIEGIVNFDLIRFVSVSAEELPPHFKPLRDDPGTYICHFTAGNPSVCDWN